MKAIELLLKESSIPFSVFDIAVGVNCILSLASLFQLLAPTYKFLKFHLYDDCHFGLLLDLESIKPAVNLDVTSTSLDK